MRCTRLKRGAIVFKKARAYEDNEECVVKLRLPKGTLVRQALMSPAEIKRRIRAQGRYGDPKNRASQAEVISIRVMSTGRLVKRATTRYGGFHYVVGHTVKPDHFDRDVTRECSSGIHFFQTRIRAKEYTV